MAVEEDGYAFHKEGSAQYQRDRMKDTILEKYGIPILRLSTNGSNEKQKLMDKLDRILNINNDGK